MANVIAICNQKRGVGKTTTEYQDVKLEKKTVVAMMKDKVEKHVKKKMNLMV